MTDTETQSAAATDPAAILMVDVRYCVRDPAPVVARFWWSRAGGLTCDSVPMRELLEAEGIAVPPGRIVRPRDGRAFFDALPYGFAGMERASAPVAVDRQEGESFA